MLDTVELARRVLGEDEVPDCKLATLAAFFGARTTPRHRALADALATADVLTGLLRGSRGRCRTLADMIAVRTLPGGDGRAGSGWPVPWSAAGPGGGLETCGRRAGRYATGDGRASAPEEADVVTAIVLIKADVARIPETAEAIAQIPQVSEVYSVTGEFDLVAMVRVRAHEELADVIPGTLNRVPGVTHTETHIAFRTYSRHDLEAAFALGYPEAN